MKNIKLAILSLATPIAFLTLSSCVDTETLEPETTGKGLTPVVLNLTAPADAQTRADDGYKLRYTAKLYSGSNTQPNTEVVQRQEMIDGDVSERGVQNQMLFYVEPGSLYVIYVFADYIPETTEANATGLYKDYFYDTSSLPYGTYKMLSTPGNKNTNDVSDLFFNNDKYDCFGAAVELTDKKTDKEVSLNAELRRLVSKVRLVDKSQFSGSYDGKLSKIYYLCQYTLDPIKSKETGWNKVSSTKKIDLLKNVEFKGAEEQELLFFYTFASIATQSAEFPEIELTLTDHVNPALVNSIATGNIIVQRNHITTVKGKLLPGIPADDPNGDVEETRDGPIILNMSIANEDWINDLESDWKSN